MALFRRKTPNEDGNPSIDPPLEKSILFLCANKTEIGINKWFILPPGADSLKKCSTISDQEKNGWFISHPYSQTRDDFPKCEGFLPVSANSRDLGDDDDDSGSDIDSCDEFHSPDFQITWPLFCGAVDWGNGHKVFVQLDDGLYFYDPCRKCWYPHSQTQTQTQTQSSSSLIEDIYREPRKFIKIVPLVSGEIVYFLCFWWGETSLIAYNLREGKRLFEFEVDSLYSLGYYDYLFEIGESKLCWISVHSGVYSKIFFSTTMLHRYHPTPCIEIQKKRRFEVPNSHFACCVSVDLSLEDIKMMTESEVPRSGSWPQGSCCSNNSPVSGCLAPDCLKIGASFGFSAETDASQSTADASEDWVLV